MSTPKPDETGPTREGVGELGPGYARDGLDAENWRCGEGMLPPPAPEQRRSLRPAEFQGRGIGTAMRQTMCALLFDHLQAEEITSAAFTDNPASLAVSRKVGYTDNGTFRMQRRPGELAWRRKL